MPLSKENFLNKLIKLEQQQELRRVKSEREGKKPQNNNNNNNNQVSEDKLEHFWMNRFDNYYKIKAFIVFVVGKLFYCLNKSRVGPKVVRLVAKCPKKIPTFIY